MKIIGSNIYDMQVEVFNTSSPHMEGKLCAIVTSSFGIDFESFRKMFFEDYQLRLFLFQMRETYLLLHVFKLQGQK